MQRPITPENAFNAFLDSLAAAGIPDWQIDRISKVMEAVSIATFGDVGTALKDIERRPALQAALMLLAQL